MLPMNPYRRLKACDASLRKTSERSDKNGHLRFLV